MASFDEILRVHAWQPIAGCPGRFVLRPASMCSPADLLGGNVSPVVTRSAFARDEVIVVAIDGGGLISYRRGDGSFVHTLCDADGFARKLAQLGIDPFVSGS